MASNNEKIKIVSASKLFCGHLIPSDITSGVLLTVDATIMGATPKQSHKLSISYVPRVVFVVDVSVSMDKSKVNLIKSLKAFYDCVSKQNIELTLITFSTNAYKIYPDGDKSFISVVETIRTCGNTNMGAGLTMAYNEFKDGKPGWIVVMTDGESNEGFHKSYEDFEKLTTKCPTNVEVLSLGYGTKYNPRILSVIGKFTYIEKPDTIPIVFGCIANEALNSWGINGKIDILQPSNNITDLKTVIGSTNLGSLYEGRSYTFGKYCDTNTNTDHLLDDPFVEELLKSKIQISYINVVTNKIEIIELDKLTIGTVETMLCSAKSQLDKQKMDFIQQIKSASSIHTLLSIGHSLTGVKTSNTIISVIPEIYRSKYYETRKGQISDILLKCIATKEMINEFKEEINCWEEKCSIVHKDELTKIFHNIMSNDELLQSRGYILSGRANSMATNQQCYSDFNTLSSSGSINYAQECSKTYDDLMKTEVTTGSTSSTQSMSSINI